VFAPLLATLAVGTCLATPVPENSTKIKAGPFTGGLARPYDVVDGRFSLRVGRMRTDELSQKIPWFLPRRFRVGPALAVTGRRMDAAGRFTQRFREAFGASGPHVFPTIIAPTAPGCWRLTLRTGPTWGSVVAFVRG
jgi:hypothetical protein